jgi:tetratricopeptide (TPR) repeat protein
MKVSALAAVCLVASVSFAQGQTSVPRAAPAPPGSANAVAEAYDQFLLARYYEDEDNVEGAIAAYRRAMELDPRAADIPAELGGLYLRQNKAQEAIAAGEQALKIDPKNREANRVLGVVYSALAENGRERGSRGRSGAAAPANDELVAKAIGHLEVANDPAGGEADPNVSATLARLYLRSGAYDKAIPLLTKLVNQEPQWPDGPLLLAEAYAGAGRARDGIAWLESRVADNPRLLPTLADFYERDRQWKEAADTYAKAIRQTPNNIDLKMRYASALLNAGSRDRIVTARDTLTDIVSARPTDARALYLLSQAQRRLGDADLAEATARKVIAQNTKSPWGYYALAEALETRQRYQDVIDTLAPVIAQSRPQAAGQPAFEAGLLLPHLGFAYQQLGQFDKAIATFEEARRLAPHDPAVFTYLADANIAAKRYDAAADVARAGLAERKDDLRLARVLAQALRRGGKADQGISVLEEALKAHSDEPSAYVALAEMYSEADRGTQAVKVLEDAQTKFPSDVTVSFQLGAVLDKQKRFADAEAIFKKVIEQDPENAAALNYLGYMLAERGERLDESVGLLKKALAIDPENGSFLDSLGWAYFKADKLALAEDNLRRAADQLKTNSVIQDHYGEVLFKLGRYDEAIAAWTRALAGDGDSIDRADIDKKIHAAKQKARK